MSPEVVGIGSGLKRARGLAQGVTPVRSGWRLLSATAAAVRDGPRRNLKRVDEQFATPDPWNYAKSEREHDCFRHQLAVLDAFREGSTFTKACEIGCAEGFFTEHLAERCESLVALELSARALSRAHARRDWGQQVRFAQWDLRCDPLPGTFDLIVLAGVLEYFHRRSAIRAAREKVVAGLNPGAHLFLVTTRSPGTEDSWWGRAFPRGSRINEFVSRHPRLRPVVSERGDWYVIDLLERTG